jgi:hypothetical protein
MMNTGYFETHGLSEVNMVKLSATSVAETNISSMLFSLTRQMASSTLMASVDTQMSAF